MSTYVTTIIHLFQCIKANIPNIVCVYFGIVMAHFICSNVYPVWCCNNTWYGFIMTPFMVVTPHCEALRWVMHYTGEQIRNVWLWIGSYLVYYITSTVTPYITNFRTNEEPRVEEDNIISEDTNTNIDENLNNEHNNGMRRRTRSSAYNIIDDNE
jgi:hypothetical protein